MKTLLKLIFVIFVVLVLVLFVGVQLAPMIATKVVESRTGFNVDLDDKRISLIAGVFNFTSLKIDNSKEFPVSEFLKVNEASIDAEVLSVLSKKIIVESVVLDVDRVVWVKNEKGEVNMHAFASGLTGDDGNDEDDGKEEKKEEKKPAKEFLAKSVTIRIGSVARMDYSHSKPLIQDFNVGYSRTFTDVTSMNQITAGLAKDLTGLGVQFLADSIVQSLLNPESFKEIGEHLLKDIGSGVEGAGDAVKGLFDKLKK